MDKPQYTSIPMQELKRIEEKTRRADSVEDLRVLFEELQRIRRKFIDDFDVQLTIGQVQQSIVDRGRMLVESSEESSRNPPFSPVGKSARVYLDAQEEKPSTLPESEHPLPPHIEKIDSHTWKRATYIGAFFALILFAAFFYLVLTLRRLNFPADESASNQAKAVAVQQKSKPEAAVPATPSLRLYTDLVPGTVTMDGEPEKALQDGELQLDNLKVGHHLVQLTGPTGNASFEFESSEKAAPQVTGAPTGSDVMIVVVSTQNGEGQLMTNATDARALVDNKDLGVIPASGLALRDLGQADHDLQIKRSDDAQRFVLTYIPAPALTVFVKSDLNAGSLVILTGEDGVDVFIDDQKYRRKTEHGQLRIPTLKAGPHTIRVAKSGFFEVPQQTIQIKKGEEARGVFRLQAQPQFASLQIKGAQPGTEIVLDGAQPATVGADGGASLANIKPGEHQIELRRDGAQPKQLQRSFKAGETITLSTPDVILAAAAAPAPVESGSATAPPPTTPQSTEPAQQPGQNTAESAAPAQPVTLPGSIHKGGGFLIYHNTKAPGRYVFSLQLQKGGGFLKSKRLQWFLGFKDTKNYVVFQVDGKHFAVRQVVDGKSDELQKGSFDCNPEEYVQIDMSVKKNSVSTRLRAGEGNWQSMGPVNVPGDDLTQGKFGVLISGSDEVGVSSIHYGK